ncbi:unnamed protein product, partial [Rotaria sp. Silwood1]
MAASQKPKGRGRPRQCTPAYPSSLTESSSSTVSKTTHDTMISTTDNVLQVIKSSPTSNSGRDPGTHLKQKYQAADPHWKVSDLTMAEFNSNVRPSKPDEQKSIGQEIQVKVNYFPILGFPRRGLVYQYDIQIKNKMNLKLSRDLQRALYQSWWNKFCQEYPQLHKYKIVFDNEHMILTLDQLLPNIDETGIIETMSAPNRFGRQEEHEILIKLVGKPVDLSLLNFLDEFQQTGNNNYLNHDDLKRIKHILSVVLHEQCSSNATYICNRLFFAQPTLDNKYGDWDLGLGKALWRGFYSCLLIGKSNCQLVINLDVSHKIFMKEQSFLDFLCDVMYHSPCGKRHWTNKRSTSKLQIQDVLQIFNKTTNNIYYEGEVEFLLNCCRNLPVRSHVADKIIGYKIESLGDAASEQTFSWKQGEQESIVTVENYYKEHYGIILKYPTLPTLRMHKGAFVPMELIDIQPIKVKRITDEQRALLCLKSTMTPSEYCQSIKEIRQNEKQQNFEQDPFVAAWNLNVDVNMLIISARVLPSPKIIYTNQFHVNCDQNQSRGVWTNTTTPFHTPTKFPSIWALINLSSSLNMELCKKFYNELSSVASGRGIDCPPPVIYEEYRVQPDSISHMITTIKEMMEHNTDCKFFITILPENNNIRDKIYGDLKKLCELEYGLGIVTQMIKLKENEGINRWNYSRLNNILMKINTKLNGINAVLQVP